MSSAQDNKSHGMAYRLLLNILRFVLFVAIFTVTFIFIDKISATMSRGMIRFLRIAALIVGGVASFYVAPIIVSVFDAFKLFFTTPIFKRRWRKFTTLKRGYWSFIIILTLFVISWFAGVLINDKALFVSYKGKYYFPVFASHYNGREFGLDSYSSPNYRVLKQIFNARNAENKAALEKMFPSKSDIPKDLSSLPKELADYIKHGPDKVILPIYPFGTTANLMEELPSRPPHPPLRGEASLKSSAWIDIFLTEDQYEFAEGRDAYLDKLSDELLAKGKDPDVEMLKVVRKEIRSGNIKLKPAVKYPWAGLYMKYDLFVLPETRPTDQELIEVFKKPEWVGYSNYQLYKKMAENGMLELKPGVEPINYPHFLGTDDRGRDVFARMVYGFRISISFSLLVTTLCYAIGICIGAFLGYYGGWFDIIMQRIVEIWSATPFLYTVMILATFITPNFFLLAIILVFFNWISMTYYIRAEFLREKSKDYVAAAKAIGCTDFEIIFKHILPNALTPVISFAPFAIVGNIGSLVSLDFLGFGLPAPTPSWGELLGQGLANLSKPWLILSPTLAMFFTLLLVSFIGEAIREAFDPKQYSRLR
ncbi:MAG: ABC transporter permease subunit [Candidatus Riflebacteria bacterium]|nr:ABC transporter permease subunit [Candidatus Riflebacteria bacterium]